ncbi:MAG: leucine-rich repeat domain-containing protein [Aureispira sp.]
MPQIKLPTIGFCSRVPLEWPPTASFFLLLFCCFIESSCGYQKPNETTPTNKTTLNLAPLPTTVQQLLEAQISSQEALFQLATRKKLPQLPEEANYWQELHYNALLAGSQRSLRRNYQRIGSSKRQLTKHLDLSYQNIYFLPDHVCYYHDLRYLSLSNNQLQALNPKLQHCQRLRKLDLSSNGLKQLPKGISYLNQIEELVLADNSLHSLPNYLSRLRNLRVLDISNLHNSAASYYNNIQRLPLVLLQMSRLEKLFLDKLPLRNLPRQMGSLRNLQVVSLNGNRALNLAQSFESLATLPHLLALDISFLGRRSLPSNIKKLQHLKVLIWHEERQGNRAFIEQTLKEWLPNTQIYYGKEKVATPFLRGNSIAVIKSLSK